MTRELRSAIPPGESISPTETTHLCHTEADQVAGASRTEKRSRYLGSLVSSGRIRFTRHAHTGRGKSRHFAIEPDCGFNDGHGQHGPRALSQSHPEGQNWP